MTPALLSLILYYSSMYGVDPLLVQSVIQIESQWNSDAIGEAGEVGLMQLHPSYFKYPVEYLKVPKNNIKLGVEYLAKVKKECVHKVDQTFLVCYNHGVAGGAKVFYPHQDRYYRDVRKVYVNFRGER